MRPTPCACLLIALLGACAAPATPAPRSTPTPAPLRSVAIDNRSGGPLSLCRAVRDGWGEQTALGDAAAISLELPAGRYALRLGHDGPRVPLPLPAAQLGYRAPAVTRVTVTPWPDDLQGFAWIPAGPALRGDALGVGQEDERPPATPHSGGFWLATTETTNAQYAAFLNAIDRGAVGDDWLDFGGSKCRVRWDDVAGAFATDAPSLPVVTVSHAGAAAYCAWRTDFTGRVHRLPTETEWEKAARGPGTRVYAYGDTFVAAAANQESGRLREVGQFAANGFGLFDMTGNAFEWTADRYVPEAYRRPAPAPGDEPGYRVLRGGSFVLDGIFVRNAMRMRLRPDVRADDVGFRVLREFP